MAWEGRGAQGAQSEGVHFISIEKTEELLGRRIDEEGQETRVQDLTEVKAYICQK